MSPLLIRGQIYTLVSSRHTGETHWAKSYQTERKELRWRRESLLRMTTSFRCREPLKLPPPTCRTSILQLCVSWEAVWSVRGRQTLPPPSQCWRVEGQTNDREHSGAESEGEEEDEDRQNEKKNNRFKVCRCLVQKYSGKKNIYMVLQSTGEIIYIYTHAYPRIASKKKSHHDKNLLHLESP